MRSDPDFRILAGDLDDRRVLALLAIHVERARAETEPGSSHALDTAGLRAPQVSFWAMWEGELVVGLGALKRLGDRHGEIKSMHVAESARGRGAGGIILRHIIDVARAEGLARLSLETGSWPYFQAAQRLYRRHGFVECPPFADYRPDHNSVFMTLALEPSRAVA